MSDDSHTVGVKEFGKITKPQIMKEGIEDVEFELQINMMKGYLLKPKSLEQIEEVPKQEFAKKSQFGSFVCAIIIMMMLLIIPIFGIVEDAIYLMGSILSIILAITCSVFFIMGGFWIFPIPLPYVTISFFGTLKPHLPKRKRMLYGTISFCAGVLAFVVPFLMRK